MIISFFLEPLQYEFIQRGMIAAILVGILCAVVGTYVVLRGMAFFGDALAHTILPGIALGYLLTGGAREPLFWWALGTAVVAALGIGAISKNAEITFFDVAAAQGVYPKTLDPKKAYTLEFVAK